MGAGSIGCFVGGSLADVAEVTLIGRPRIIEAVAQDGLELTTYTGRSRRVPPARLALTTEPEDVEGADVVLLTVKSGATRTAVEQIAPYLAPSVPVLSLQNGLRNTEIARAVLPAHPVVAGMVSFNVVATSAAVFHQATSGEVMVGDDLAVAPLVERSRETDLPFAVRTDMREVQHGKLLLNLMNAVVALADRPLKECLGERGYRLVLARCQREALAVFRAEGVRPARLGPVPPAVTARVLRAPDAVFTRVAAAQLQVDPSARSSMWDDLQQGRRTEVDELQGAVVAMGERHGIPTPVCARLVELVHERERTPVADRTPWSASALLAEVG